MQETVRQHTNPGGHDTQSWGTVSLAPATRPNTSPGAPEYLPGSAPASSSVHNCVGVLMGPNNRGSGVNSGPRYSNHIWGPLRPLACPATCPLQRNPNSQPSPSRKPHVPALGPLVDCRRLPHTALHNGDLETVSAFLCGFLCQVGGGHGAPQCPALPQAVSPRKAANQDSAWRRGRGQDWRVRTETRQDPPQCTWPWPSQDPEPHHRQACPEGPGAPQGLLWAVSWQGPQPRFWEVPSGHLGSTSQQEGGNPTRSRTPSHSCLPAGNRQLLREEVGDRAFGGPQTTPMKPLPLPGDLWA